MFNQYIKESVYMYSLDEVRAVDPEIADAISAMRGVGAAGVTMSGSGSTVFGLVDCEADGARAAKALSAAGIWARCARMLTA